MAKKTVSELAKQLAVDRKNVISQVEKLGKTKVTAKTTLTDEEAEKVKEGLGLGPKPQVRIGEERVIADNVVSEAGRTTRERVTELRTTGTLIRRRRVSEKVASEAPAELPPEGDGLPAAEEMLGDMSEDLPPLPPEAPIAPPPIAEPPLKAPPAAVIVEAVVAPPPPPPPPAVAKAPTPPAPPPAAAAPSVPATEAPVRPSRVLGRIDLKKVEPPPRTTTRPAAPGAGADARRARLDLGTKPAAPAEEESKDKKRKKLKVIKKDPLESERDYRTGRMPKKKRALPGKELKKTEITVPKASKRVIRISNMVPVGELAKQMGVKAGEVLKKLMDLGMMATINQQLDFDSATLVAQDFDYAIENVAFDAESAIEMEHEGEEGEEAKEPRPPVVTIMGHVDHGKTSLLDAIRKTNVTEGEAGGITQHIGAYSVTWNDRRITFVDTPGHEAFTAMRARGAKVTDIVVLVVAADDGVMPQTVEAISHARAANVPIIVTINKIDKPDANLERVKRGLADHGLASEDWGGDTAQVPVSAKTQQGIPDLLEMILLQADVLELRANPAKLARGVIIEAKLERGRGPVATVLVQEGTLHAGDPFVCGTQYGRVRAMVDEHGAKLEEAGPSTPVEILGLGGVPEAGDVFSAVSDEATAKQVASARLDKKRQAQLSTTSKVSLEELYDKIKAGEAKELRVILKADVQGSVEALQKALGLLSTDEVKLNVLHASVGGVSESDVLLASASKAIIIGFGIRPEAKASDLAEREGVDIRLYNIIYEALNDMRAALEGMLAPTIREKVVGRAEVRQPFPIPGVGTIAGSFVTEGKINRSARVRLVRDSVQVYDGKIASLRRFKDDVREVASGLECGIGLENFNDVKAGDVIEAFEVEEVARRLMPPAQRSGMPAERSA
ncbi:MAG: translation initiation factor IF-2 [Deltaproteobacteria bacterium]|nr:translation initiation factor IF-2 [Deltaproteobacteria bacterium]